MVVNNEKITNKEKAEIIDDNSQNTNDDKQNREKRYLNFGEEDEMEITGFTLNRPKNAITTIGYFLTLGILRLVFHWYPQYKLTFTHSPAPLGQSEKLLITDRYKGKYKSYFVKDVEILKCPHNDENGTTKNDDDHLTAYLSDGSKKRISEARTVKVKKLLYIWDNDKGKYLKLCGLDKGTKNCELHNYRQGYSQHQQQSKRITYGINEINVPVQSVITLLILEALTPFYMFQLFSLIVWLAEDYYYYAVAIVIMSVFGITTSIVQTRRNQKNLKGTVHLTDKVQVSRGGTTFEEVPTSDLVPGDVIVIPPHGCEMQCDAVLLNGNCIVNESMLTGESVPITKTPLPGNEQLYDVQNHSNHTIFCGTRVIQTRYYSNEHVLAVVTRTGYLTAKGELVRSILYPPPADFKFDQDSYKFIIILAVVACISFLYTIFSKASRNIAPLDILIKALDVVTIAVPPALPAAMTVGKLYALNRLKKRNIYCINSRVINVSGSVNCICFDKTGTLTEDGLDMWGVVQSENGILSAAIKNVQEGLAKSSLLFRGMLTCHSLTLIEDELCGDPLDIKMFEATGWVLEEPSMADNTKYDLLVPTILKPPTNQIDGDEIGLIQQFQFSSNLQRMSVISRHFQSDHFEVFCKGSPEMIISLSKPETVPDDIQIRLRDYTEKGYRVIGMGRRIIDDVPFHRIQKLHREDVECDLEFVGLIILDNRLKPQTNDVIATLKGAGMKIVMITGDNIQTAVSVARECGIIRAGYSVIDVVTQRPTKLDHAQIQYHETTATTNNNRQNRKLKDPECGLESKYHLVLTGQAWEDINLYFRHLIPKIVTKGVVFARMSGHQKQQLIEELQNLGYYVAMCGDGANDCGALKAAHVGISLSEAESSVASPFTSKEANISCTAEIIKEGRAALVTSFGVFKVMLCYSLTELASVLILYSIDSNLTSIQFLFIDICLVLNFASFFGKTEAYPKLHKNPPTTSLLSLIPLTSILLFMLIAIGYQVGSFLIIQQFDWFVPFVFDANNPTGYASYENYAVFTASLFQYVTLVVVFSKGRPFRKTLLSNYLLMTSLVVSTAICIYITIDAAGWIRDVLELTLPPQFNGKLLVLIVGALSFVTCFIFEELIVDYVLRKKIQPRFKKFQKIPLYVTVQKELTDNPIWPIFNLKTKFIEENEKNNLENCEITKF